jgi:hypothetical protein
MRRLLILLAVVIPFAAFGRIGETPEQCEQRYGKPVRVSAEGGLVFIKNDIQITVFFDATNRVNWMYYEPTKGSLSEQDIQTLLKANANETWVPHPKPEVPGELFAPHAALQALAFDSSLTVLTEEFDRQGKSLRDLARLWLTREQCEKKYGQAVAAQDKGAVVFRKNGIDMTTYFDTSNRVEWIEYRGCDFTMAVIKRFLDSNAREDWVTVNPTMYHADKAKLTAIVTNAAMRVYPDDWPAREQRRHEDHNSLNGF